MLYVTHDQIEAMTLANRIGVLDHGRLVQVGTPQQIYEDPASSTIAARLGSPRINLLPRSALPALPAPASASTVGVRAEHLRLTGAGGHARAHVRRIELLSDLHLVHIGLDDTPHELVISAPPGVRFEPGQAVSVEFLQSLWFDAAGQRIAA